MFYTLMMFISDKIQKVFLDVYINSGLEWLKSKDTMNVFWEEWLGDFDKKFVEDMFGRIIFENPIEVAEKYMWQKREVSDLIL
ncbi:MAG: hypothetical protein IPG78_18440 [Ignavibacteria bacterium]|nr:hypothetical protein [Ignavibacteria bacterium]